jgi:hypothetical protein
MHYGPPPNFDFDFKGAMNNPVVTDKNSYLYNLDDLGTQLAYFFTNVSVCYQGDNIMYTFGGDF